MEIILLYLPEILTFIISLIGSYIGLHKINKKYEAKRIEDVEARIMEVKCELKNDMDKIKQNYLDRFADLKSDIKSVKDELREDIKELREIIVTKLK